MENREDEWPQAAKVVNNHEKTHWSLSPVGWVVFSPSLFFLQQWKQMKVEAIMNRQKATNWTDSTLKILDFDNSGKSSKVLSSQVILAFAYHPTSAIVSLVVFTHKSSSGGSNSWCGFSTVKQHSHSQQLMDWGQNHANSLTLKAIFSLSI